MSREEAVDDVFSNDPEHALGLEPDAEAPVVDDDFLIDDALAENTSQPMQTSVTLLSKTTRNAESIVKMRKDEPLVPSKKRSALVTLFFAVMLFSGVGLLGKAAGLAGLIPAPRTPAVTQVSQKRIDQFQVGDQVVAENPTGERDESLGEKIIANQWRKLTLHAPKNDGSWSDVTLLRPLTWLNEQQAAVGGTVYISVPECGIDGNAELLSVEPCPPIDATPGSRTVTGVFKHHSANVIDVHVDGLDSPIGATANHPFWSEDRQDFIRADTLQPGETLRGLNGLLTVTRTAPRTSPEPVFNLEVHRDHVYHVSDAGVLVHNAVPDDCDLVQITGLKGPEGSVNAPRDVGPSPRTPVGRSGQQHSFPNPNAPRPRNSPTTINGRDYSGHAIDRMQERGFVPSVVENAIITGTPTAGRNGTTVFTDTVNNMRVIVDSASGRVVTVIPGG